MKLYRLGLYEKSMPSELSWREKLQCAKESGFDFIEMSIDESDAKLARLDSSKEERLKMIEAMYEIGIPIKTICLSGHRKYPLGSKDEATRNYSLTVMEKAIDLACDLGISIIQLAGYDVYYEESTEQTKDLFEKNLRKCVELAAKKGVILAFETMETDFMNTVGKAMYYVNKINSPYLKVYPDIGNLTNSAIADSRDEIIDFGNGEGNVVAVHLKETVPGKFREIPFGTGHVDFEKMIHEAWRLGVRKYVAEFWYVGNEQWKQDIKLTREFMEQCFSNALDSERSSII